MATEIIFADQGVLLGYTLSCMVAPQGWLCLAPVAVAPKAQGCGIGSQMVPLALKWAAERGLCVVVLGNPGFCGGLGFSQARAAGLRGPCQASHMLLAGPGADVPEQTLLYPAAFDGV